MPEEEKKEEAGCTPEYCARPEIKNIEEVIRQAENITPVKQDDAQASSNNKENK